MILVRVSVSHSRHKLIACGTILDINYVHFSQYQRDFIPQAELEEAFIYIIHNIDFCLDKGPTMADCPAPSAKTL